MKIKLQKEITTGVIDNYCCHGKIIFLAKVQVNMFWYNFVDITKSGCKFVCFSTKKSFPLNFNSSTFLKE